MVGTPGRVLDHLERGNLRLEELKWFVLDEADRMLDMGFSEDVEKVVDYCVKSGGETSGTRLVPDRIQVLLFSATIPSWVRDVTTKYMHPDKVVGASREGDRRSDSGILRTRRSRNRVLRHEEELQRAGGRGLFA